MKRKDGEAFTLKEDQLLPINLSVMDDLNKRLTSNESPYNFEPTNRSGDINFIHLPKCAGNFLYYYFLWDRLPVHTITHDKRRQHDIVSEDFYFTVVRNPFDFWVSMFFFNKDSNQSGTYYWNQEERESQRSSTEPEIIKYHFNNFIEWAYEDWNSGNSVHLLPITENYKTYCFTQNGRFLPNTVCKFESLHQDVGAMLESLGFDNATENINKHSELEIWKNKTKHKKYTEYYDKSSIEKVSYMEKYILEKYDYAYD